MKISEVTLPAKVTKVMPNQSAEIDHGDGTKTLVDLKKNPQALAKDPETGKVKLSTQQAKPGQQSTTSQSTVKPGDKVELETEATTAPGSELFKGLHIEVRPNKMGGFDVVDTGVSGLAPTKVIKSFNNAEEATKVAKMLDAEDMKVASTMPSSIKVHDDADLNSLRRNAGIQ